MEIKILKLRTGEEIIGNFDGDVNIEDVAKIIIIPTEGGMSMGLMPWLPYSNDKSVKINRDAIDAVINPSEDMKNSYSEQFGSGLVTPSKDLII